MIQLHVHSDSSNISSPDVAISCAMLVERAKVLGQPAIALTDHGNNINKFRFAKECKARNIKPIFGLEGYYVRDRNALVEKQIKGKTVQQPDTANGHIILLAKNYEGFKEINRLMSDSFVNGFYRKPRIDRKSLHQFISPKNVIIMSACLGSFINKYGAEVLEDFEDYMDSFYLEVQPHNDEKQRAYNNELLKLSINKNIPLVASNDIHAIDTKSSNIRSEYVKTKGIFYEDEGDFYCDYPSDAEVKLRFKRQQVFSNEQIDDMLQMTYTINEQIEEYDILDYSLKIPVLKSLEHLDYDERHEHLTQIIYGKFKEYECTDRQSYIDNIETELSEVYKCKMADYFIINYYINELAINKYGGILTATSRGSSSCFLINFFLGFTKMDKLKFSNLPLVYDRFMTSERILESKTPPDIDLNVACQEPFIRSAKELVGEDNVYPMVALGLFQVKSAWKLFSRMYDVEPDLANEVSNHIEDWTKAKKYADEEDKDLIIVEDYIPKDYLDMFNESKDMRNIIDTIKPHACGVLISPISITDHIGLISVGGEENRIVCCAIEGNTAGDLGYLKNDYLIVGVVEIIDKIYKRVGIEQPTPAQLVEMCEGDQAVWDIYSKGITFEVNQMTSPRTVKYLKEFKPKSVYDLSTVVASIRPAAISVVDRMMSRKPYAYGSKIIDDLLSSHTGSTPAILYQESIMRLLALAGFPQKETYTILKAISKKKESVIHSAKDKFIEGMVKRLMEENNGL